MFPGAFAAANQTAKFVKDRHGHGGGRSRSDSSVSHHGTNHHIKRTASRDSKSTSSRASGEAQQARSKRDEKKKSVPKSVACPSVAIDNLSSSSIHSASSAASTKSARKLVGIFTRINKTPKKSEEVESIERLQEAVKRAEENERVLMSKIDALLIAAKENMAKRNQRGMLLKL